MSSNRRLMMGGGSKIVGKEKSEIIAGDILCAKEDGSKIVIDSTDYSHIRSPWTAIAVVVIPPSHDVYGTGEGAAVSLKCMDDSNPDNGSSTIISIQWGPKLTNNTVDYTGRPKYGYINYVIGNWDQVFCVSTTTSERFCFASDYNSHLQNPLDTNTYWPRFYPSNDQLPLPSPYLTDGSKSEIYSQTYYPNYDTTCPGNNALSDFNGIANTNALTQISTYQSNWRTASTIDKISTSYKVMHFPAACCCWRYHTVGTNQGDWYLPACGEMGYLSARWKLISTTMYKLGFNYTARGCMGWTSTEVNTSYAFIVSEDVYSGMTYNNSGSLVWAFIRF